MGNDTLINTKAIIYSAYQSDSLGFLCGYYGLHNWTYHTRLTPDFWCHAQKQKLLQVAGVSMLIWNHTDTGCCAVAYVGESDKGISKYEYNYYWVISHCYQF